MFSIRPEVSELRELLQELYINTTSKPNLVSKITTKDKSFFNNVLTMHIRCPQCAKAYIREYNACQQGIKYIDIDLELKLKTRTQSQ